MFIASARELKEKLREERNVNQNRNISLLTELLTLLMLQGYKHCAPDGANFLAYIKLTF